jgi:hypothetical protein
VLHEDQSVGDVPVLRLAARAITIFRQAFSSDAFGLRLG